MQVFLNRFRASGKSYTKKSVKMFPFYCFFEFLDIKNWAIFTILYQLFYMLYWSIVQIFTKTDSIYYLKCSKTPIFGLFLGGYRFLRFWPIRLSPIISKPFQIDLKNRSRKPYYMVLAFRAENPRKPPTKSKDHDLRRMVTGRKLIKFNITVFVSLGAFYSTL